jgi:hypothetical protein
VLPGNWEVVYGKAMLIKNMNAYTAAKVCANMFHSGTADASPIFPPYQIFDRGGIRVGFVGYNDPLTPSRQSPAYSRGITFTQPERDLANYVSVLRREKGCHLVFVLCRIVGVAEPRRRDVTIHQVVTEYLALHSPVSPTVEGRAVATDAPADLLSQVEGTSYRFR